MPLLGSRRYEPNAGEALTATGTAASSTTVLLVGELYVLAVSVDVWFRTDGTDAAVDTDGSYFLSKGATDVMGSGATISLIKHTGESDGSGSIGLGSL